MPQSGEEWFGFWEYRIRQPDMFVQIRTPQWSSHAATMMAKQWIIGQVENIRPHDVPKEELARIQFYRQSTRHGSVQAHVREGRLPNGEWETQSILIPQYAFVDGELVNISEDIGHDLACYISKRLDRHPSSFC